MSYQTLTLGELALMRTLYLLNSKQNPEVFDATKIIRVNVAGK